MYYFNNKNQRLVAVLQGVCGSGKSTFAQKEEVENGAYVISMEDIKKDISKENERAGMADCSVEMFSDFISEISAKDAAPYIVLDDNFTSVTITAPYVVAAKSFGYDFKIFRFMTDLKTSFDRNNKTRSFSKLEKQAREIENFSLHCPRWWNIEKNTIKIFDEANKYKNYECANINF